MPTGGATLTGSNVDATKEPGEPDHAGDSGGASVWYSWTPNFTGAASIDTAGSNFDTLLAVYAGGSLGSLTLLGSDDDVGSAGSTGRVCLAVAAGQTVEIAVDGFDGDTGNVQLAIGPKTDSAPCPALPPTITNGSGPLVGDTLHMSAGSFVDPGAAGVQWLRCYAAFCDPIDGATGAAYTITSRDTGTAIKLEVSSTGGGTTANNQSEPTQIISTTENVGSQNGRIFWSTKLSSASSEILSADLFGSDVKTIVSDTNDLRNPVVSPDVSQIAYVGAGGDLFLIASTGSGGSFDSGVQGNNPTWSPDGSRIAFIPPHSPGAPPSIDVWDLATGSVYPLYSFQQNTDVSDLAWSPDGTRIALTYTDFTIPPSGRSHIAVIAADGHGPLDVLLNSSTQSQRAPAWDPSSSEIAFVQDNDPQPGQSDLWIMNADGSGGVRVSPSVGPAEHVSSASWSPDASTIVYSDGGGASDLYLIDATGGAPTQLTGDAVSGATNETPDWAPLVAYSLATTVAGTGSGTVTSSPVGISCPGTCSGYFDDPTLVTLMEVAASGSTFAGWTGSCLGTGPCTVTVNDAKSVTATFNTIPAPPPPPPPPPPPSGGSSGGSSGGGSGGVYPDLKLVLTSDSPNAPSVGSPLVYHIVVSDHPQTFGASQVFVDVTLPPGYALTNTYADRGTGCTAAPPGLVCSLDWISPGVDGHITITGTVGQAGAQTATASVRHWLAEGNPADNTMTVTLDPPASTSTPSGSGSGAVTLVSPATITGRATVGSSLIAIPPKWSATPSRAVYQWQLCAGSRCAAIKGATKLTLKLTNTEAGKSVRLVTIATFNGATLTSNSKKILIGKIKR